MKQTKKLNPYFKIILVILIIIFVCLTNKSFVKQTRVYKIIKEQTVNVASFFYQPIDTTIYKIKNKNALLKENDNLKKELELLKLIKNKNEELEKEQKELQSLLDLKNVYVSYNLVNASVLIRDYNYWFQTMIIDKGEVDKIRSKDIVVSSYGLIGIVSDVTKNTSTVTLITSGLSKDQISVAVEGENGYFSGIISGYKEGNIIIKGLSSYEGININSKVLTTGLGNYKAGILVGYVTKIEEDNYNLGKTIYVSVPKDISNLKYVTIIRGNND